MTENKNSSIVRRMFIAVGMGFVIGFICLYLKATLKGTSGEGVWNFIHALLFQDITQTKSLEGLGLFILYHRSVIHARPSDDDRSAGHYVIEPCALQSCRS